MNKQMISKDGKPEDNNLPYFILFIYTLHNIMGQQWNGAEGFSYKSFIVRKKYQVPQEINRWEKQKISKDEETLVNESNIYDEGKGRKSSRGFKRSKTLVLGLLHDPS